MEKFPQKAARIMQEHGSLCIGLDPTNQILKDWGLSCDIKGLHAFCDIMKEVCTEAVGIIKPQVAYFEQYGPEGMACMRDMALYLKARGNLLIYDAKRGDIGSTSEAYAAAYFGPDSPFQADAITVNPTLGFGAVKPILDKAAEHGGGVFIVVRSSNPEGEMLQEARCSNGQTVAESLALNISAFNERYIENGLGPVGAVIGATLKNMDKFLALMPSSLFLSPGIGHQGASFDDIRSSFGESARRAIPSSSRGILNQGPGVDKITKAVIQERQESFKLTL